MSQNIAQYSTIELLYKYICNNKDIKNPKDWELEPEKVVLVHRHLFKI